MKTVLVVDDQPELRQLVTLSLSDLDCRVQQADNGEAALVMARAEVPDVIVLDLTMPGNPDGFGVCWEIKSDARFARTKVIILSGQNIRDSHRAWDALDADAFMAKPFLPSELAACVGEMLREDDEQPIGARKRILIVDDNPELRRLVGATLGSAEYDLCEAGSGAEALQVARHFRPDVVVLDVILPGGFSGYDVFRSMRSDGSLAKVPVLFLSSRCDPQDLAEAARLKADDYVAKPFSPLDLISRVNRLLGPNMGRAVL